MHGLRHMFALSSYVDMLVMDPLQSMAGDVVAEFLECGAELRIFLQSCGNAKHGQREFAFFKFTKNTPNPSAGAIFVNPFHADMPIRKGGRVEHFRQKLL